MLLRRTQFGRRDRHVPGRNDRDRDRHRGTEWRCDIRRSITAGWHQHDHGDLRRRRLAHAQPSSVVARVADNGFRAIAAPMVVLLQRYGYHMQHTTLVLTFGAALDAASAENVHDYQIVTLGGRGRGGKLVGRATAIRKAIYDPSTFDGNTGPGTST